MVQTDLTAGPATGSTPAPALTVDELASATGVSVRNIRYYASLGLLPAPERRGRVAYYGAEHQARLDLIRALQDHGFTLQAIERYLSRLADDVTVEDLAMQRAMIASWTNAEPADVYRRIGRELRRLGLPRDALAAAQEITARHLDALADDLTALLRDQVVEPWRRTQHSAEEAAHLEAGLPRLRELTTEAMVIAFQDAANRAIGRGLRLED